MNYLIFYFLFFFLERRQNIFFSATTTDKTEALTKFVVKKAINIEVGNEEGLSTVEGLDQGKYLSFVIP